MKKVLVFSGCNDFNAVEQAIENAKEGNEVYFLECDKNVGVCQHNIKGNKIMCKHCQLSMRHMLKGLGLANNVHYLWLKDIICEEDKTKAASFKCDFNSVQELKDLEYEGAQVGYGAFSSYVTFSRNVMPEMTVEFKRYISYLIQKEIIVFEALKRIHTIHHFDLMVFHNGRFAQFKPFLEFAKLYSIDFLCTEQNIVDNHLLKDYFYNDIPHSLDYLAHNVLRNWDIGDPKTREGIGRSFFEKRKDGIPAGDKVYVKDQHAGELPKDWENSVENITIFNSSEDEFCAISTDYDNNFLFPNQYIALKTIFDHYKDDQTKHFYVRIHPNLRKVPYKSHIALYGLKYKNVTIIPPDSTVSSYTLLDHSDKIIIFGSTIGVEAAYWGKPVISLVKYIYWNLGLMHHPNNQIELWECIDNKNLQVVKSQNLIKYGYWILQRNNPEITCAPYCYVNFKFLGRHFSDYTIMKALGSFKLHVILETAFRKVSLFSKFKQLPCTEPYQE